MYLDMYFAVVYVLFLLGLSQAHVRNNEQIEFKRVVRSALHDFSSQNIPRLENLIIDSCKANGQIEAADNLQTTFDDMKSCFKGRKILLTSKTTLLNLLEVCTRDALNETKSCLPANLKYLPDFLLTAARARINFIYDNLDIIRSALVPCYSKFSGEDALNTYKKCLNGIDGYHLNTNKIESSKAEYCKSFISARNCFINLIQGACDETQTLLTFKQKYQTLNKFVCEENVV